MKKRAKKVSRERKRSEERKERDKEKEFEHGEFYPKLSFSLSLSLSHFFPSIRARSFVLSFRRSFWNQCFSLFSCAMAGRNLLDCT